MYSIQQLAEWLLAKESMTNKKLQKMAYYSVAWSYALLEKQVFEEDEFQAWVHGPVSPVLYHDYKENKWEEIPNNGIEAPKFDGEIEELLESVWFTYGEETGNGLEALSHSERPWIVARSGYSENENCDVVIKKEDMKSFYLSIYEED
ncbi:Panacea domain-containing protein [Listeria seeligeri]|uniref:Panacea domain-containing protein n=1 Tax=Listeria seeligeri TaxID=1640 RepID=UPI0016289AC1|nr:type II toxin-antitoxin system antitoxin SocA domain-containing protein [Listeria seeligeri]MBC1722231.1 DUF4065 domain-containing protein [Listeria seeligeri]MBC1824247.1 DUF4065 domain-containing protein [Listeria seeligeri]MBC1837819.1 DUF4065 domain-containing protein [Listeria seeligeri]MBF2435758.1 DUF4065 domain-containing protein [Listeria seeligeri]MBF2600766.1 DUF4065 domain-containing protein [Listeria seeligeri]